MNAKKVRNRSWKWILENIFSIVKGFIATGGIALLISIYSEQGEIKETVDDTKDKIDTVAAKQDTTIAMQDTAQAIADTVAFKVDSSSTKSSQWQRISRADRDTTKKLLREILQLLKSK